MIRLTGIERVFTVGDEQVHARRGVSLASEQGEYLAIMGPSGSGKSSLLNVLGLLDRPNAGRYELEDRDVTGLSDDELARVRREKIGFVFQFFHLVPRLTAEQNIELPMVLAGLEPAERRRRLDRLLAEYGLEPRARHRPDQLSGGQCQRVAIARAMSMNPGVILADEPTGNLDRSTGQEVITLLEGLHARGGTLIMVTHDAEIGSRAKRRIRIVDGHIVGDEQ
ncbi:MAG: ABC transporter ATP-binding protein [Rhodocyclaceae bacterium]|nr:ABC transporter ATP-binding protein [Rhodocyclaceae bacterium]